MDYNLFPKLEMTAAVRQAIEMWRQSDARSLITEIRLDDGCTYQFWDYKIKKIGDQLLEKASQLSIPRILRASVKTAIRPVGKEILVYVSEMVGLFKPQFETFFIDHLCWTPFGIIDQKKSAQSFLENGFFSEHVRYPLACQYICKEYIPVLWKNLPQNVQRYGSDRDRDSDLSDEDCSEKCIVKYWSSLTDGYLGHSLNNDDEGRDLPPVASWERVVDFAKYSIMECNFAAFIYFWEKFSDEEKEENVVKLAIVSLTMNPDQAIGRLSTMTIFLLSRMNPNQQTSLFERHSFCIVKCLGNFWFSHHFFLPTVKFVWNSIDGDYFCKLLQMTAQKFSENAWEVEEYEKWFVELWMQSSSKLKKYVINIPRFLYRYLADGTNFKCMKLIIDETNGEERKKFFQSYGMTEMWERSMTTGKWEFFDRLLKYSFSYEDLTEVKNVLITNGNINLSGNTPLGWAI